MCYLFCILTDSKGRIWPWCQDTSVIINRSMLKFIVKLDIRSVWFLIPFYLCIGASQEANAYQPVYWTPISDYIVGNNTKPGPASLTVKTAKGKILERATYKYNSSGKLVRETYWDTQGKKKGYTRYYYKKNQLIKEQLMDRSGKILNQLKFFYRNGVLLTNIRNYQEDGNLQSQQFFKYNEGLLVGGEEVVESRKDQFQIFYEPKPLRSQVVIRNKYTGKLLEIFYKYHSDGRLKERKRQTKDGITERCVYEYTEKSRLSTYKYYQKTISKDKKEKWIMTKKVILNYRS